MNAVTLELLAVKAELVRLRDENRRLKALLADLRARSVEEGITHFVNLIDEQQK